MRKSLILTAILAVFAVGTAIAQPRAIGGRLGYNLDVSYQHSVGDNFVEIDAGLLGYGWGVHATAIHDWVIAKPNWTPKGEWAWYAGVGGNFGFSWVGSNYLMVGVAGQVGLEYKFWFPLALSIDYRPSIGIGILPGAEKPVGFDATVASLGDVALSVRYAF